MQTDAWPFGENRRATHRSHAAAPVPRAPIQAPRILVIITRNGGDGPRIADGRAEVAGFVARLMDQNPAR